MFNGCVFHVKNAPITVTSQVRRGNNGPNPFNRDSKKPGAWRVNATNKWKLGSLVRPRSAYRAGWQLHDTRAKKRAGSRGTGSAHHGNHLFHKHSLETAAPLRAASTLSASLKLGPTSSPLSASVCDPHLCKASVCASPGCLQCLVNVQFELEFENLLVLAKKGLQEPRVHQRLNWTHLSIIIKPTYAFQGGFKSICH